MQCPCGRPAGKSKNGIPRTYCSKAHQLEYQSRVGSLPKVNYAGYLPVKMRKK